MQKKCNFFWSIQKKAVLLHPLFASKGGKSRSRILIKSSLARSPGGGIGRRVGLKHQWETVPVRSRPWVQIRLNRKFLITNACDFFFLFFNPFVKTHDEQIGQTTMSSLLQAPDFLHGYIGALLTNKYPPLSRLVVYCAGRPN